MARYLLTKKDYIKYAIKRLFFHNKTASRIAAYARYFFPNPDLIGTLNELIKVRKGEAYEIDWKYDKEFILNCLFCRKYYAITLDEFYLFGLDQEKNKEKNNLVGWGELAYYEMLLNKEGHPEIFESKQKTYEVFKEFFQRDVVMISDTRDKKKANAFFIQHGSGIVKPDDDYGGHGISIYRLSNDESFEQIWNTLSLKCPFILEELIEQDNEMKRFYSGSVNSIRYNTFYHDGKLTRLQAVLRMGRDGSEVDNASSGGIFTLVDVESGRILGPAKDHNGFIFETHPNTGVRFEGSFIPKWDELNHLVEKIVRVIPEQKQVGWDFALSEKGWVLIEGNATPMYQDFDPNHGAREAVKKTYGQVIKMWE